MSEISYAEIKNCDSDLLSYSNTSIISDDTTSLPYSSLLQIKKSIKKEGSTKSKKQIFKRVKARIIENIYHNEEQSTAEAEENNKDSIVCLAKRQSQDSCQDLLSSSSSNYSCNILFGVEKPIDNYKYFMCAGDLMIELYHEDELEFAQERRICSYRNLKRVTKVEKIGGAVRVILETNKNVVKDFSYICYLLDCKQDQRLHIFSELLKNYQVFLKNYQEYVESIVNYYKQTSMRDFNILRELRQAYFIDYISKTASTLPEDEFYIIVQIGPGFQNMSPNFNIFQISPALIALLGVDQEQIMHLFLRNGIRELTVHNQKQEDYIMQLQRMMLALQTGQMPSVRNYPLNLYTFDNIAVKGHSSADYLDVPLPSYLEYKSTTGVSRNLDKISIITFNFDVPEIQKLIKIRKQPEYKQIIAEQLDHFEYSVHSAIFIEKFYNNQLQVNQFS